MREQQFKLVTPIEEGMVSEVSTERAACVLDRVRARFEIL
jgi:hypothetical protein